MKWILLPGLDGTGNLFAPFIRALPPEIIPVVVSYPTDRICPANELLEVVLSRLPENEPYILLAESFSGPLALNASVLHHAPPAALILCALFARCPVPRSMIALAKVCGGVLDCRRPPRLMIRRYLLGPAPAEAFAMFYEALAAVPSRVLLSRLAVLREFDDNYAPASLKSPLLYLRATRDRLIGGRHLDVLRRRYPSVHVEKINAPHLMLQVEPEASARAILRFVAEYSI